MSTITNRLSRALIPVMIMAAVILVSSGMVRTREQSRAATMDDSRYAVEMPGGSYTTLVNTLNEVSWR